MSPLRHRRDSGPAAPPPRRGDYSPAAPPPRRRDSGFALLLVFAMAAVVGIMLWLEVPRVAFEAERIREETLIQRGEEYKHAIKLFYRRFQRYPPSLEALDNTNNIRFIRRRYKDPMTGKDDWRQIHAGPGGIFTDSLTQKPAQPQQQQNKDSIFTSVSDMAASSNSDSQQPVVSMIPRRRPSEGVQGPPGADQPANPNPGQTGPPDQLAQLPPVDSGQPAQPTLAQPGQSAQPTQPGQPGQPPYLGAQPGQPGQPGLPFSGQPGQPGQPGMIPGAPPGMGTSPAGMTPSGPTDGSAAGPGATPVPGLINNMLRNPPAQNTLGGGAMTIGGGIAGVASKMEAQGIMIYNDRKKFNEWEFIYDPRKEMAAQMGALQNALQQPVMPGATSQPGQQPGQTTPSPITSFGSQTSNQH